MKKLNNFIFEKLKVNSKTKINKNDQIESKEIIDIITYYFNIDPFKIEDEKEKNDYEKAISKITEWIEFYKVKDIKFACDLETINNFVRYVKDEKRKKDILKEYDTRGTLNEKCQELLEDSVTLYQHYSTHFGLKYNNDKMICISYKYGTIYGLNIDKI